MEPLLPLTSLSEEEKLNVFSNKQSVTLLPAMLFVGLLLVVGLLGNCLVCFIFATRLKSGTQNFLIVCLAALDLLSCAVTMPMEIVDMRHLYTYNSNVACKLQRFIIFFSCISSNLTLGIIAADRFLKLCRPMGRQMTVGTVKISVFVAIVLALLACVPVVFIYGIRTLETKERGLFGKECSTSDDVSNTKYPLIYNIILFITFVAMAVTFIVVYVKIYQTVKRRHNTRNISNVPSLFSQMAVHISSSSPETPSTSTDPPKFKETCTSRNVRIKTNDKMASGTVIFATIPLVGDAPDTTDMNIPSEVYAKSLESEIPQVAKTTTTSVFDSKTSILDTNHTIWNEMRNTNLSLIKDVQADLSVALVRRIEPTVPEEWDSGHIVTCEDISQRTRTKGCEYSSRLGPEARTTIIALLVTSVFVVSFLPYLGLTFVRLFDQEFSYRLHGASLATYHLFLRFYFVNSAVNPIIYGFLNLRFRAEVCKTLGMLKGWNRQFIG